MRRRADTGRLREPADLVFVGDAFLSQFELIVEFIAVDVLACFVLDEFVLLIEFVFVIVLIGIVVVVALLILVVVFVIIEVEFVVAGLTGIPGLARFTVLAIRFVNAELGIGVAGFSVFAIAGGLAGFRGRFIAAGRRAAVVGIRLGGRVRRDRRQRRNADRGSLSRHGRGRRHGTERGRHSFRSARDLRQGHGQRGRARPDQRGRRAGQPVRRRRRHGSG